MTSEEFYKKTEVVREYDKVRFSGIGGDYINKKELETVLSLVKENNGSIIEIGPGTGRLSEKLLKKTKKLTLFDNSKKMLKILKKKFKDKNIKFIQGDVRNIKLKEKFEYYVSLRVFIHLTNRELLYALRSANKILNKNGYILMDTLNSKSLYPIIKPISILKTKYPYNHFISEKNVVSIIEKTGFKVIEIKKIFVIPKFIIRYSPLFKKSLIKFNEFLERKLPNISTHLFWKIQKIK